MNELLNNYLNNLNININSNKKTVFYTALFKKNKKVDTPGKIKKNNNFDYIIFTNIENLETDWDIKKVPLFNNNVILTNRIFKWLSHIILKNYNFVIYMDCFYTPIFNYNLKTDSIIHKYHIKRNCVYRELNACYKSKKINLNTKKNFLDYLKKNNISKNIIIYHNDIFMKNNNNNIINNCLIEMINIMIENNIYRDQVILPFIYYNYKIKPDIYDLNLVVNNNGKKVIHKYY